MCADFQKLFWGLDALNGMARKTSAKTCLDNQISVWKRIGLGESLDSQSGFS